MRSFEGSSERGASGAQIWCAEVGNEVGRERESCRVAKDEESDRIRGRRSRGGDQREQRVVVADKTLSACISIRKERRKKNSKRER